MANAGTAAGAGLECDVIDGLGRAAGVDFAGWFTVGFGTAEVDGVERWVVGRFGLAVGRGVGTISALPHCGQGISAPAATASTSSF